MNFSLTAMLYASAVVATSIAGFGVGGLFLAATTLAIWRLALPGDKPLPPMAERVLVGYVIVTLAPVLLFYSSIGLEGWAFDPREYDLARQVCRWVFIVVAVAPIAWWSKQKPLPLANDKEDESHELPEDFP